MGSSPAHLLKVLQEEIRGDDQGVPILSEQERAKVSLVLCHLLRLICLCSRNCLIQGLVGATREENLLNVEYDDVALPPVAVLD